MVNAIYMLFDRVSQSYIGSMMLFNNDLVCKRSLKSFVNSSDFPYRDMVEDLTLYKLGDFDLSTGTIAPNKEMVVNLIDLREESK